MSKHEIIQLLKGSPPLSARQIHHQLNKTNVHKQLKSLMDEGVLEQIIGFINTCETCGYIDRKSRWKYVGGVV